MSSSLVTVICLCYNHANYLREAIESVLNQTYQRVQIIVVDDASTDGSVQEINGLKASHPSLELMLLSRNVGNCKAFNAALKLVRGEYIVDFATDDVMMPNRIERQLDFFTSHNESVGVVFTDAIYIDKDGKSFRNHYEYLKRKRLLDVVPQGDVYCDVLARYFIASPTMMMKREVIEALNGYDEDLAYEDFDFWVRSSRLYEYTFLDERLTKIRRTGHSMSSGWYVPGDKQLHSTYLVCKKASLLNRNDAERQALIRRVRYEFRQSVFSENSIEANLFYAFLVELQGTSFLNSLFFVANKLHLPLSFLRRAYHKVRFS